MNSSFFLLFFNLCVLFFSSSFLLFNRVTTIHTYHWIRHKNNRDINKPKRGKKQKKKQKKEASTFNRTIMKRKHADGGDSVSADRKRSKTLMHYPCNTRVSMVWPDKIR